MAPRITRPPSNACLREGEDWILEIVVEGANSVLLSRDFMPVGLGLINLSILLRPPQKSIDRGVLSLTKGSNDTWTLVMKDLAPEQAGLYFLTARNSSTEEKYPVLLQVTTLPSLDAVTECGFEDGLGAPLLSDVGPMFVRDGDDLILKTSLRAGRAPFRIEWTHNGQPVSWSARIAPYNREGCVGLRILGAGSQDEGSYCCSVSNSEGAASFSATLLVDCKLS